MNRDGAMSEHLGAIAHELPISRERVDREGDPPKGVIHGIGKVLECVQQRAVEIEDDGSQ